jgi:hypothetical protein
MSRLLAVGALVLALGAPAQAGSGGKCFHACDPCEYAPGSGAHLDYDRHHKVKLATKCNWSASRLYPNN